MASINDLRKEAGEAAAGMSDTELLSAYAEFSGMHPREVAAEFGYLGVGPGKWTNRFAASVDGLLAEWHAPGPAQTEHAFLAELELARAKAHGAVFSTGEIRTPGDAVDFGAGQLVDHFLVTLAVIAALSIVAASRFRSRTGTEDRPVASPQISRGAFSLSRPDGRGVFIKNYLFTLLACWAPAVVSMLVSRDPTTGAWIYGFVYLYTIFPTIRRLRDLEQSKFWAALILVPFVCALLAIYLAVARGKTRATAASLPPSATPEQNQSGDPKDARPEAQVSTATVPCTTQPTSTASRLAALHALHTQGLISDQVLEEKQRQIVADL